MPVVSAVTPSQGVTLKKAAGAAIAFLTSIDGLSLKAGTIDTTGLDTAGGYKTFIQGFREVDDLSISGSYSSFDHDIFITDFNSGTSAQYTVQFPAAGGAATGSKWVFTGIVTSFKHKAAVDNVVSFDVSIKVVGAPTFTAAV
ncbi:phage tail tube protein [Paenibacillus sp. OV219]|uniref:phage tail tube protein n=1 Tax=Paenibacillus sp. OV219 TaxID=1884377 RepID=UPI0008B423DB|nr:phage tail tube protein [Paenibacillus sp. OV219]SEN19230.1 hypothetical protein SAMN05518847_102380 [Paenibacillus sp. OV219]